MTCVTCTRKRKGKDSAGGGAQVALYDGVAVWGAVMMNIRGVVPPIPQPQPTNSVAAVVRVRAGFRSMLPDGELLAFPCAPVVVEKPRNVALVVVGSYKK
jgi:hypothetical protein